MKADVTTLDAKKAGTIELDDDVYGLKPRADILHRMVRYQLAKRQAGTHSVQDRSEVTGTQAKAFKQKGTGRAEGAWFWRRIGKNFLHRVTDSEPRKATDIRHFSLERAKPR